MQNLTNLTVNLYPAGAPTATVTIPCLGAPASYLAGDYVLVVFRDDQPSSGIVVGILSEATLGITST